MAKIFDAVRYGSPKRNKFNLSHQRKMAMKMGLIYPMMVQEILPGDSFRVNTESFVRLAPMLAPIMHEVNVYTHYFFVPNRLVWNEFEDFITGGKDGTAAPVAPYIQVSQGMVESGYVTNGTLWDYMGLRSIYTDSTLVANLRVSALPFRAYQMIWNEYFRDQNLSPETPFGLGSGNASGDYVNLMTLRKRCWEKDYFTSALPFAQRGPAVTMPIEGVGDVTYKPFSTVTDATGNPLNANKMLGTSTPASLGRLMTKDSVADFGSQARIENIDQVTLDNAETTINDLRRAVRLQEWLEKMARGGYRYIEQMLVMFGVKSSDARLQRPEFLGGGKTPVSIGEVVSTFQSPDGEGNPQANMAGHGVSVGGKNGFKRTFEEHGYVIGVVSVIPRTAYQQGIPKHFTRFDKFDYAWPTFANIGEQEVKNSEIYFDYSAAGAYNTSTFGYQSRYAEYKYAPTTVHGTFRESLGFWHMGRIFAAPPSLNAGFVESDPTTRIFAVEDATETLYCTMNHRVDAVRPLPYFGTPML